MLKGWKHPLGIMEFSELQYFIPAQREKEANMSTINNNIENTKVETIDEIIFDCLRPKKVTNKASQAVLNIRNTVERELEKGGENKNWAIREIPLDLLEVDMAYQREPKNCEIAKITNSFDLNRVEVKAASIRKVDGVWHIYLMDGAHTLSSLLFMRSRGYNVKSMTCKTFINLSQQQEASLFASQNLGKTNIRGYERYKAELCARYPEALAIDKVTKEFGLTIKTNHSETYINRYKNINAIEELYRIVRRHGEDGLRFVFQIIKDLHWEEDKMSYTQRMLGGLIKIYPTCVSDDEKKDAIIVGLSAFKSSNEFFDYAVYHGTGDHYSDLVGSCALSFAW